MEAGLTGPHRAGVHAKLIASTGGMVNQAHIERFQPQHRVMCESPCVRRAGVVTCTGVMARWLWMGTQNLQIG